MHSRRQHKKLYLLSIVIGTYYDLLLCGRPKRMFQRLGRRGRGKINTVVAIRRTNSALFMFASRGEKDNLYETMVMSVQLIIATKRKGTKSDSDSVLLPSNFIVSTYIKCPIYECTIKSFFHIIAFVLSMLMIRRKSGVAE